MSHLKLKDQIEIKFKSLDQKMFVSKAQRPNKLSLKSYRPKVYNNLELT